MMSPDDAAFEHLLLCGDLGDTAEGAEPGGAAANRVSVRRVEEEEQKSCRETRPLVPVSKSCDSRTRFCQRENFPPSVLQPEF